MQKEIKQNSTIPHIISSVLTFCTLVEIIRIHSQFLYKILNLLISTVKIPWLAKHRVFPTPATIKNATTTSTIVALILVLGIRFC